MGLAVGLWACLALHWADAIAWTQEDRDAAERLLDLRLEQRPVAEVRAKARAKAEASAARRRAADSIAAGMAEIPGGAFRMGCSVGDGECSDREKPAHRVTVRGFRLGRREVTQAQWRAIMGYNRFRLTGDDRPVDNVSRKEITKFLARLNASSGGKRYRLPTEAEWEYAARAGTDTAYWWGTAIGNGNANCRDCGSQWGGKETAPVGAFKPNAFGIFDTSGNVAEWVEDCDHENYAGAPDDGSAWDAYRCFDLGVVRGGSATDFAWSARVSARGQYSRDPHEAGFGLRLAHDL
jgi:formylglycine-generating enzyme required for sulfatase activity